jgi:hypothetical protein
MNAKTEDRPVLIVEVARWDTVDVLAYRWDDDWPRVLRFWRERAPKGEVLLTAYGLCHGCRLDLYPK